MPKPTLESKIKKLTDLGVSLTGQETEKEINSLLKNYKGHTPTASSDGEANINPSDKEKTVVRYINPDKGLTTREFSREIHGKDFHKIAQQFSEKHMGEIVTE